MHTLLAEIAGCTHCAPWLPLGPRPVLQASTAARILVIGQAPGAKVHARGIPWDDKSGDELRRWLEVDKAQFYDSRLFALVPMGFCYPGRGSSGDLPPRAECAPLWHPRLLQAMPQVRLTLLIGKYAQRRYLGDRCLPGVTDNVRQYQGFLPEYFPLVHPSPRNNIWKKRHPWFEAEVLPALRERVQQAIA